jgi:hypothetical protein
VLNFWNFSVSTRRGFDEKRFLGLETCICGSSVCTMQCAKKRSMHQPGLSAPYGILALKARLRTSPRMMHPAPTYCIVLQHRNCTSTFTRTDQLHVSTGWFATPLPFSIFAHFSTDCLLIKTAVKLLQKISENTHSVWIDIVRATTTHSRREELHICVNFPQTLEKNDVCIRTRDTAGAKCKAFWGDGVGARAKLLSLLALRSHRSRSSVCVAHT